MNKLLRLLVVSLFLTGSLLAVAVPAQKPPFAVGVSTVDSHSAQTVETTNPPCFNLSTTLTSKIRETKIAVVESTFTSSAYAKPGFYDFYKIHAQAETNVTQDLSLLNVTVLDTWGINDPLSAFLRSDQARDCGIILRNNVSVFTDENLTLHPELLSKFQVVILGFEEYVSSKEYHAFKSWTANGGTLIVIGAGTFIAEVGYSPSSRHVWLIRGHGWVFNGRSAWKHQPYEKWQTDTTNWLGSNHCCFTPANSKNSGKPIYAIANTTNPLSLALRSKFGLKVFRSYIQHEEMALSNSTNSVIAYFIGNFTDLHGRIVAAYEHRYRAGDVIDFGCMCNDIIGKDPSAQYLLVQSILSSKPLQESENTLHTSSVTVAEGSQPLLQAWLYRIISAVGWVLAVALIILVVIRATRNRSAEHQHNELK